jgi:hypothetical protein
MKVTYERNQVRLFVERPYRDTAFSKGKDFRKEWENARQDFQRDTTTNLYGS